MSQCNTPARPQAASASIWLLVQLRDQAKIFEFAPHSDRCLVIGSGMGADLRLEGLAPVALYLQRDGAGMRIIPASAEGGVRVNSQPAPGPCLVHRQALVELRGHQIALYFSDVAPPMAESAAPPNAPACAATPGGRSGERFDPGHPQLETGASPRREAPKTFVLGTQSSPNALEPSLSRSGTVVVQPAAVPSERLEPAPIVALSPSFGPGPSCHGTQALSPDELAAVRARIPAAAPVPWAARGVVERLDVASPRARGQTPVTVAAEAVPIESQPKPAGSAALPKVIPFEPLRVGPAPFSDPEPAARSHGNSTVIEAKAVNPAASVPRAKATNSDRLDAMALRTRTPSGSVIARLGEIAKRYPVGVIGGAMVAGLVVMVFLVGAAQLLRPAVPRRAPDRAVVTTAVLPAHAASASSGSLQVDRQGAAPVPAAPARRSSGEEEDHSVPNAVGHLFASRLPEAEQAYGELAASHPEEPIFATLTRLLAKRNSPDCRTQNNTVKSCPTVKP